MYNDTKYGGQYPMTEPFPVLRIVGALLLLAATLASPKKKAKTIP